jgi:hypothetical protein
MDIMEANTMAFQTTPHSCNASTAHFFPYCDGGGCGMRTYRQSTGAYGPGDEYTIDTRKPFEAALSFHTDDQGQLVQVDTVLTQGDSRFALINNGSGCKNGKEPTYLAGMTETLRHGMVAVFSFWGDQGSEMQWLDVPPCDVNTNCPDDIFASISNIKVAALAHDARE